MRRLAIALLLFAALDAAACECGKRWPVEKQFAEAPIVFVGRVERIHDRWTLLAKMRQWFRKDANVWQHYCDDYGVEVTFTVSESWKGVSSRRITIVTGRGGGDCGVEFKDGVEYVVYAYPPGHDGCQTNICTRTREVAYAGDDLAFLRRQKG